MTVPLEEFTVNGNFLPLSGLEVTSVVKWFSYWSMKALTSQIEKLA
jgi:hypothetical protein